MNRGGLLSFADQPGIGVLVTTPPSASRYHGLAMDVTATSGTQRWWWETLDTGSAPHVAPWSSVPVSRGTRALSSDLADSASPHRKRGLILGERGDRVEAGARQTGLRVEDLELDAAPDC